MTEHVEHPARDRCNERFTSADRAAAQDAPSEWLHENEALLGLLREVWAAPAAVLEHHGDRH